jgi:hypothetical protein
VTAGRPHEDDAPLGGPRQATPPRIGLRETIPAVGLLVLAGFAALGALQSTSENAPLFLFFAAIHVVAAVGVALRRGWGRTLGVVLTCIWLLGQGLVALAIVAALVVPGGAAAVTPETLLLTAAFTLLAGGTLWLLIRLPSR